MGHFLAVTAVQGVGCQELSQAVITYLAKFEVGCKTVALPLEREPSEKSNALVYEPVNDWAVVVWPQYFNIHDFPCAQWLSEASQALASTISVYDGDLWSHGLFEKGKELSQFRSIPDFFAESREEAERERSKWRADPEVIGRALGVSSKLVAPYLVHLPKSKVSGFTARLRSLLGPKTTGKVFSEDQSEIEDFWVFVDFWRKLGIVYPDVVGYSTCLRLTRDFSRKLPTYD